MIAHDSKSCRGHTLVGSNPTLSVLSHRSRVLPLDRLFRRGSQRIASSLVIASVKGPLDLREQEQCMDVLTAFDYNYMVPRCC